MTAFVFEIFFDSSRSRSSMFRKSELPPKFSWYRAVEVDAALAEQADVSTRCVIVAPTCDLMSSPMIGRPRSSKRRCQ